MPANAANIGYHTMKLQKFGVLLLMKKRSVMKQETAQI